MAGLEILLVGWTTDEMTLGAVDKLKSGKHIILRTERCGAAEYLKSNGIPYETFDALYDEYDDFDELNENIAERLVEIGDAVYCVNDPCDESVRFLLTKDAANVQFCSCCGVRNILMLMAGNTVTHVDASDYEHMPCEASKALIVSEIDNRFLAGEVKVRLMDTYGEEHEIILADGNTIKSIPLYELDRLEHYDHRLCMLVPAIDDLKRRGKYTFSDLLEIMEALLSPNGCPWDKEQTHESLRTTMIEEAYEAVDAINNEDTDALYDELGDVLFQVVFHSAIGEKHAEFDITDVTDAICRKLIERHPHVFSDVDCSDSSETTLLWEQMKAKKRGYSEPAQALKNITYGLPALLKCAKMLHKTDVLELKKPEMIFGDSEEDAIGKKLYEIVDETNRLGVDPESALQKVIGRYIAAAMEVNS